MLIAHVLQLKKKETAEFIPPQLWPPNSPNLIPHDYSLRGLLQEKVYKIRITDLDELKQRLRTEWAKLDHVVIAAANHGVVVVQISDACFIHLRLQYFPHTVINWIQIWRIWSNS